MPANSPTEPALLIVALSARALAESARLGGLAPRVLDGFADLDTRAAADAWRRVPLRAGGLDGKTLLAAADALDPEQRLPVVCGSGFENRTRLLARLCRRRPLLGNTPATIRAVKQPHRLAELLARLGIPHPETVEAKGKTGKRNRVGWATCCPRGSGSAAPSPLPLSREGRGVQALQVGWAKAQRCPRGSGIIRVGNQLPTLLEGNPGNWLIKRAGASGGGHVRPGSARLRRGDYRQRRVPGRSLSLLFLADGRRARPVGWNETWCDTSDPACPYRYGGALTLDPEQVPEVIRAELPTALDRLVSATGLVGLCGVDLIADDPRWWLIEINPRPPATIDLHERETGLLILHRDAVHGRLPDALSPLTGCRGHAVAYAPKSLRIAGIDWPAWISDRPSPGTIIDTGQPLCTLRTTGASPAEVRTRLARQCDQLLASLFDGHSPCRPQH